MQGQHEGMAPSRGVDIHYTIFGEGPPLLILNGGPGFPSTHFGALAQRLAGKRQAIIFDQRGTGQSRLEELSSETLTLELMLEDIEALRRHLNIERWAVMGHSWGGMYAMSYAARYPERVDRLILSASGGIDLEFTRHLAANIRSRLSPEEYEQYQWALNNPGAPDARRKRLQAMAAAYVYHREHIPTVVRYLADESEFVPEVNRLVWQELSRIGYDLREELSTFERPVLILQGRQDLIGESTAYEIHRALPLSQLELVNECSHYLWLDQPEAYFSRIEAFLASKEAP